MVELEGVKILLCHGHRYHVKSTLLPLYLAARENGVRLALFGHTHTALLEEKDGITLLNPGSCGFQHASQLRCGRTFRRGIHLPH